MGRHSDTSEDDISNDTEEDSSSDEETTRKKVKKSKSSSHKKKKTKDKKKGKKSRKRSSSEDESSGSEEEWVIKSKPVEGSAEDSLPSKKPKVEEPLKVVDKEVDNNEWNEFGDAFQTFSNDGKRSERRKKKEQDRESSSIDQMGQHVNELNPYWKDGGTGLPEENTAPKQKPSQVIGDGGLSYLRKAFIRAKEQATEQGRSVEDVVSERWGSLEKFLAMLEEAESKAKGNDYKRKDRRRRDRSDSRERSRRFIRPSRDSDDDDRPSSSRYSHSSSRRRDREDRPRERRRSRDRNSGWRKNKSPERQSSNRRRSSSVEKRRRSSRSPEKVDTKLVEKNQPPVESVGRKERGHASPVNDDELMEVVEEVPKVLNDKEMNELGAKLLKAEMLGNDSLMEELRAKIKEAETARQEFIKSGGDPSKQQAAATKVVTKIMMDNPNDRRRRRDKIAETHKDGQRVRYFPDDDKQTLQNMFQREKMNTAADENALFARIAGKGAKTGQDFDIDDVFESKASSSKQSKKEEERELRDVLDKDKHYSKVLDTCAWCFDGRGIERHLIVSTAEKSYLCVPPYQSMAEGHCLIVPMSHVSSATELDEDVWAEMQKFRKVLTRMFREADQDMVIFETAVFLKRHPHMFLECVPMPKETGELAPIYFKKAIQECETEWAQNKKLVDLRNRDVRRAIPKGLPYFSVDFGDDSCGFAHVIEDERTFPRNFAHEIVGGMMELDHHVWRKQRKDDFKTQRNKVMEFLKLWGPYDWTRGDTAN